jgi:hypothetical protein
VSGSDLPTFTAADLPALTRSTPPGTRQAPVQGDPQAMAAAAIPEPHPAALREKRRAAQRDLATRMVNARANRGGLLALFQPNPGALYVPSGKGGALRRSK